MWVLIASVSLLAGCDKLFTLTHVDDPQIDARDTDAADDASSCAFGQFGKYGANDNGLLRACLSAQPHGDYVLPDVVDTRDDLMCSERVRQEGAAQDLCLISATNLIVNKPVRAFGSLPLVLLATETITITSSLDASSVRTVANGPGNNHGTCVLLRTEDGAPGGPTTAAGGGAGGTFQTKGGDGGSGEGGSSKGGSADAVVPLSFIRGGCPGGDGGRAGALNGGNGGTSGGALYLIAGTSITLSGIALVNASGAGGAGGGKATDRAGAGGGGGSGGLIGFDSPKVLILDGARVIANGGGGGGSAGSGNGPAGENGESVDITAAPFPATGGTLVTAGGYGFDASRAAAAGTDGQGTESGGGGGGGAGYIKIYTTDLTNSSANFSPSPN